MKGLIRKRNALLKKLVMYSVFMRGSVNSVCANCQRASCICAKKTSCKSYRLTYKDSQQRTRIVYIPQSKLGQVKRMIANYAKWRKTMEQLMETNVEMFKAESRG